MSDFDAPFECQQCGTCCFGVGGVRLSPAEAEAAASYLHIKLEELKRLYLQDGEPPWDIRVDYEKFCLFHQPNGRCLIHPVKPGVCRAWPYLPGTLREESAFFEAKAACPGLRDDLNWEEFKAAARGERSE